MSWQLAWFASAKGSARSRPAGIFPFRFGREPPFVAGRSLLRFVEFLQRLGVIIPRYFDREIGLLSELGFHDEFELFLGHFGLPKPKGPGDRNDLLTFIGKSADFDRKGFGVRIYPRPTSRVRSIIRRIRLSLRSIVLESPAKVTLVNPFSGEEQLVVQRIMFSAKRTRRPQYQPL